MNGLKVLLFSIIAVAAVACGQPLDIEAGDAQAAQYALDEKDPVTPVTPEQYKALVDKCATESHEDCIDQVSKDEPAGSLARTVCGGCKNGIGQCCTLVRKGFGFEIKCRAVGCACIGGPLQEYCTYNLPIG